jgi:hypothetical protein
MGGWEAVLRWEITFTNRMGDVKVNIFFLPIGKQLTKQGFSTFNRIVAGEIRTFSVHVPADYWKRD